MSRRDDSDLVRKSMKGERTAFEALLLKYEKPVYNAAYQMLGSSDDARDVTQTVFLKAYENLCQYNPKYRFFSWIYRIALNESINCLNQRTRTEELVGEPAAETGGPDDETDSVYQSRRIQSALLKIKPEYRSVIVLRHFHEFNYVEIGEILDIPEKKVKSRLYSGRQMLREALQDSRLS